jgi:hypothetical protein
MRESQLTNLLLLILVGFLVYKLTAPVDIKNEGKLEKLSDTDELQETTPEERQESAEETQEERQETEELEAEEAEVVDNEEESVQVQQKPSVSNKVHSFRGLEEEENVASLDSAFQRPIETGKQKPEEIDFNKNVVKKYDSKDYLPKEVNDEWFDTDFSKAKVDSKDEKMIPTAKYVIGVNTVGQSLKNASYDIRGTIPNPKYTVSPWNNSTYEPDYNIKPMC